MTAYRIADGRFPLFDGIGAMLHGGRWNSPGHPVIYAAETFANAMLEALVHTNLSTVPKHYAFIEIEIPHIVAVETVDLAQLPRWPKPNEADCRAVGDRWLHESRTAVLRVPSIVTTGRERNLLINPNHPDFIEIRATQPQPVTWDPRLFLAGR